MKSHKIYKLINLVSNTPFYIGRTSNDLSLRLSAHRGEKGFGRNELKNNYIDSLGDNIGIELIEEFFGSVQEANVVEKKWIVEYMKTCTLMNRKICRPLSVSERKETITIRVTPSDKKKLESIAKRRTRKVGYVVSQIVGNYLN